MIRPLAKDRESTGWKRPNSAHRGRPAFLIGLCLLILGCTLPSQTDEATEAAEAKQRNVRLSISAGPIGNRVLITNHSQEVLSDISMILNQGDGGGYRHTLGRLLPNATLHFTFRVYKKQDGTRYTGTAQQITSITVFADTPRGSGRWYSTYP